MDEQQQGVRSVTHTVGQNSTKKTVEGGGCHHDTVCAFYLK